MKNQNNRYGLGIMRPHLCDRTGGPGLWHAGALVAILVMMVLPTCGLSAEEPGGGAGRAPPPSSAGDQAGPPAAPANTPGSPGGTVEPPTAPGAPAGEATPAPAQPPSAAPTQPPGTVQPEGPPAPVVPKKPLQGPILMNFKDVSVRAVLEYLSEAAGLVVVQESPVEGRVTVMSLQPLTVDEAVSLLNTVLKEKGYAAVRTGRVLRIVSLDQAKKAPLPVRSGSDPDEIEPSDQLITQVIPIRSADATQLRRDLASLIPSYADLSANAATNTLILTDTQTNVKRFVEIIRALDTQTTTVNEVRVYQLKYANAANAARLINELFKQDQTSQTGAPSPFGAIREFLFRGGGPFGGPPGGPRGEFGERGREGDFRRPEGGERSSSVSTGRREQQKVTASSDDRTNTLVVSGPPELLAVIDDIMKQLDSNPTEEQAVFTYPLKNANAVNVEAVLNTLFGWSGTTVGRTTTGVQSGTSPFRTGTRSSGIGGSAFGRSSSALSGAMGSGVFGGGTFGSGAFGSTGFGTTTYGGRSTSIARGSTRLSASASASAFDLAGQVYVVADEDTNSLLVTTSSKNFDRVKAILAELDRPVPQVLIKVLIAEVTHDDSLDLGAEFSALNLRASGQGQSGGTDFSIAAETGGLTVSILENHFTAALRALATKGKLDILSRPYILTSDNQQASIMVGEEVPFITRSQLTESGQTINTIEYDNIGIILTVTPHINPEGLVIMDVYPEISARSGPPVPISETVDAPVFARRAAQSRVAIRDGQTIVIGGLMEDRNNETVEKVPLLGDLPWVGALFRRTVKEKTKTELLIFLTPHVAKVPDDLASMSASEQEGTKAIRNTVDPGTFDEHMKGMQRGAPAPRPQAPPQDPVPEKQDGE